MSARENPPSLPVTRTGTDWCPSCELEAGTNRTDCDRCATCGTELVSLPPRLPRAGGWLT